MQQKKKFPLLASRFHYGGIWARIFPRDRTGGSTTGTAPVSTPAAALSRATNNFNSGSSFMAAWNSATSTGFNAPKHEGKFVLPFIPL
jgi:hypothetical protein